MWSYVGRRLALAVPLLFAVVVILFSLMQAAPGDMLGSFLGEFPVPDDYRERIIEAYGLDESLWTQFWSYLGAVLTGDLGYSFASGAAVSELIASRLPATLWLVSGGLVLGTVIGVLFGLLAALVNRRGVGSAINVAVLVAFAIPGFWLGQILVIVFALELAWFPTSGFHSFGVEPGTIGYATDSLHHLVLPVIALGAIEFAAIARTTRQSAVDVSALDHLTTAQLKGLAWVDIVRRHVVRNACLPVVTVIGYRFGQAFAGALLIEKIFGWPGLGTLLEQAVLTRDNQTVIGVVLVVALLIVLVNLVVDVVYSALDPRIRRA